MASRHTFLLTPLESALPRWLPFYKQNAPVSPLESALTSHSQVTENTATLSSLECAVTDFSPASPLECAVLKKQGVGATLSTLVLRHSSTPTEARGHSALRCLGALSVSALYSSSFGSSLSTFNLRLSTSSRITNHQSAPRFARKERRFASEIHLREAESGTKMQPICFLWR